MYIRLFFFLRLAISLLVLVPVQAAEPNSTSNSQNDYTFCIKNALECDPIMRPHMLDVQSSKKHSATLSLFKNVLKTEQPSECSRILKEESMTTFEDLNKSKIEKLNLHFLRAGNVMICLDALIYSMSRLFLHFCIVESDAIAQRVIKADTTIEPSRISTRALQSYYSNQAIFQRLENGDTTISWQDFFDASKAIILSHDKELLKLMLQPTLTIAPYLARKKKSTHLKQIIDQYLKTVSHLVETFAADSTINKSRGLQSLITEIAQYHKTLKQHSKTTEPSEQAPVEIQKSLARFMTYHTHFDLLRSVFHEHIIDAFNQIATELKNNPQLLKTVSFGEICSSKQYLANLFEQREIIPSMDHEMLSQFKTIAYFARHALNEIESPRQINRNPDSNTSMSIQKQTDGTFHHKSHKLTFKRKKKKRAEASIDSTIGSFETLSIVDQPNGANQSEKLASENKKLKIASDGSYVRARDISDETITIHAHDDGLQVDLWKKKVMSNTTFDGIMYTPYVLEWLNNPKQALEKKRITATRLYALGKEQEAIDVHAFPRLVDQYVESLASHSTVASRDNTDIATARWIPGTMTRNNASTTGLFIYLFNKNNVCFHRMFDKRSHTEIIRDIKMNNALEQYHTTQQSDD